MNKLLNIISWLSVILLITGSRILTSAETPALDVKLQLNKDTLVWCGDDNAKSFVLTVNIGTMTSTDSLYGYNFQINYDSTKVILSDLLTVGTLSENCDFKSGGNDTLGHFRASAMMMGMTPMTGNLPLVAIQGYLKEDCYDLPEDSVKITMDYLEFTNEFTYDSIAAFEDTYFPIRRNSAISESQYLKLRVMEDSLNLLDTVPTMRLYVEIPDLSIHNISFSIDYSDLKDYFSQDFTGLIDSVTCDGAKTEFVDMQNGNHLAEIRVENDDLFLRGDRIYVYLKQVDSIYTEADAQNFNLYVTPHELEECNCLGAYLSDSVKIETFVEKTDDVKEISDLTLYRFDGENLSFSNDYDNITIYDLRGGLILARQGLSAGETIQLASQMNGVFFAVLEKNKILTRIQIIKH